MLEVSSTVSLSLSMCRCVVVFECVCVCAVHTATDCIGPQYMNTHQPLWNKRNSILLTVSHADFAKLARSALLLSYPIAWAETNCKCTLVHCKLDAEIHEIVHFSAFNWYYKFSKLQPIGLGSHHIASYTYTLARYTISQCGEWFANAFVCFIFSLSENYSIVREDADIALLLRDIAADWNRCQCEICVHLAKGCRKNWFVRMSRMGNFWYRIVWL